MYFVRAWFWYTVCFFFICQCLYILKEVRRVSFPNLIMLRILPFAYITSQINSSYLFIGFILVRWNIYLLNKPDLCIGIFWFLFALLRKQKHILFLKSLRYTILSVVRVFCSFVTLYVCCLPRKTKTVERDMI